MRLDAFTWRHFIAFVKMRAWAVIPVVAIVWGVAPLQVDGKWALTLITLLLLGVVHAIEYIVLGRREARASSSRATDRESRDEGSHRRQPRNRQTSP